MNVTKELEKWKADYAACHTPEEFAAHKQRFTAFLQSLSPAEKKEFAQAFKEGAKQSAFMCAEARKL